MIMNIQKTKLIVDVLMFLAFLVEAISGFILWFVLPRGSGNNSIFLLQRFQWLNMHDLFAVILTLLIIIHLILNWTWIISWIKRK